MELEFFCKPGTEMDWFSYWRKHCMDFLVSMGINKDELRYRDHEASELSFYSNATTDIEYNFLGVLVNYGELHQELIMI